MAISLSDQQIGDTVIRRRAQNQCFGGTPQLIDGVLHVVGGHDWSECLAESVRAARSLHLQAHEKTAGVFTRELLRLGDVSLRIHHRTTNGVHNAWFIGTAEGHDKVTGGGAHPTSLGIARRWECGWKDAESLWAGGPLRG